MTRIELVTLILARLGNRTGTTLYDQAVAELKFRQSILEREAMLPWFLLNEAAVTVSAEAVTLPTGFLREYEDDSFFVLNTDSGLYDPLQKDIPTHIFENEDLRGTGQPRAYYLLQTLHVFPTPTQSYTGRFFYYKSEAVLSADETSNAWSTYAHDLLAAEAGFTVARYLRDFNAAELFKIDISDARRRIVQEDTARKQAAYHAFLGVR